MAGDLGWDWVRPETVCLKAQVALQAVYVGVCLGASRSKTEAHKAALAAVAVAGNRDRMGRSRDAAAA